MVLALSGAKAQDIVGVWKGTLDVGTPLRLVFHVTAQDNAIGAKMDSPDQNAYGIPCDKVSFKDGQFVVGISRIQMGYNGVLKGDTISGTFIQGGLQLPLKLVRDKEAKTESARLRPQDPVEPYPYRSEDVTFMNAAADIRLAGTLTYPTKGRRFPAVVLISGSGLQDRNGEAMGVNHRPFLVLSDFLTRNGIAVLRFDDRGYGESEGRESVNSATTRDFAADALAAVEYLKGRSEIDGRKIGLVGHSEGGQCAFMGAADNGDIAFVVSMAGVGVPMDSVLRYQVPAIMRASGGDKELCSEQLALTNALIDVIGKYSADYVMANHSAIEDSLMPAGPNRLGLTKDALSRSLWTYNLPWMRFQLSYDPVGDVSRVRCPVLALNGDRDTQVDADANLSAIERVLKDSGNSHVTVSRYAGLNHMFQTCVSGAPIEYARIEETMSPIVMQDVTAWILGVVGK